MATIADVAKQAKVSMMTVSRVINNSPNVRAATKKRVLSAIDQLNYQPNMVAKGLATGRSGLIAYVVTDISVMYYGLVSKGIENACFDRGYTVIIYEVCSKERMSDCIDMMLSRRIDGAIFHDANLLPEQAERLSAAGVRCVTIDNEIDLGDVSRVDTDNLGGGRLAAEHLLSRGHRSIGVMTGILEDAGPDAPYVDTFQRRVWRERTQGFVGALREAGLAPAFLAEGCASLSEGFRAGQVMMREILARADRPSAVYCENDIMALGAVSKLMESGVPFPDSMAVIGHDGLEMCIGLYPHITTVVQPRYRIGQVAAGMLLERIENGPPAAYRALPSTIFQGDTT
ncbi:MAG: LacI family transcriptional regulator [Clostridiales bacterium]|mgnify:CR=1 FL=1|nr:LacI family transcriptional regulator [Clostridiales bacterium]